MIRAGVGGIMDTVRAYRRPAMLLLHVGLATLGYPLAFLLRFDFGPSATDWRWLAGTIPLLVVLKALAFWWFHISDALWRYLSMRDIMAIVKAGTLGSFVFSVGVMAASGGAFPKTVLILEWLLGLALVGGARLACRAAWEWRRNGYSTGKRALVVGAGDAAEMLGRDIERNRQLPYEVVGFVDDDPRKQGCRLHGIAVAGTIDEVPELCRSLNVEIILIAIPSATRKQKQRIVQRCRESGITFKSVPGLSELFAGRARIGQLQEVRPEDLLGRAAVRLDVDNLRRDLCGKRILVTGAAGSIGSELCRQLAAFEPDTLVLFDRAESGVYFAELELRHQHKHLRLVPVVGDILDRRKVEEVLDAHSPDVVYHAAAYKHVPLMEEHPLGAIENNVFGTEIVARASQERKVKKFVLISTDKAVNPVAIMGMTKRLAECLLLSLNGASTAFVAVRFGNVLGTDGSVLPVFNWQISHGGPVTITDPDASRYFMLPSEAAQLVIQAGAMGRGGEVFFLDMGEPIRISDLAENLIRLSGMEPGRDMPIEVMGLRPGERLREELALAHEELLPTAHEKVFMVRNHNFAPADFCRDLEILRSSVQSWDRNRAVARLREMALRY